VITLVTLAATSIIAIAFYLVLIPLLGEKYASSYTPFLYLLFGVIPFAPGYVWTAFLAGIGKPEKNLHGSMLGLALTILLNFLLIPGLGARGAAIATSVSYVGTSAFALYYFTKETRVRPIDLLLYGIRGDLAFLSVRLRQILMPTPSGSFR
jgi:O-antigen/teichoic acid export membrane protein